MKPRPTPPVSIDPKMRLAREQDVSVCLDQDKAILYHPDTRLEKVLNPTALVIWKKLNGVNSVYDIVRALSGQYKTSAKNDILTDVREFLSGLLEDHFVEFATDAAEILPDVEYPDLADRPGGFDISLTGKCNLHCEYCFYAEEMRGRLDLPEDAWFAFFDELGALSVRNLTLSGGEVFVRPRLFDLIDRLIENRMRYSLLTNGTLITEKNLSSFETKKRRLRMSSIQVSIDGSCAEVHDKSRGKGSFERAIRGLRLLKEAGFPVTVRVTVNRYNVDDLENIARLLLVEVGLSGFGTNDAMPMGAGCDNQAGITLLAGQKAVAMRILSRLTEEYDKRITATAGPLAKWRMYGEMEHAKATGEMASRWKMGYLTACGCIFNKLSVHHDGVITPCNMLSTLEIGRINRDSIKAIWKNHPTLKALKDRRAIPMSRVPGCEGCEWSPYCNGSCPGLAQTMTGDFNRANPHDCYRRFLEETGLTSATVPWRID